MAKPLPPMNALRAFEAAARHNGYIAAAEELCVTRGAVSRHVKLLEAHLGVSLFTRHPKGVDLTRAGAELQPVLTDAFARIGRGLDAIAPSSDAGLRVICPPTISIRWLLPRLETFRALHPDIEVSLSTAFYGSKGFDPRENDIGFSVMVWPGRAEGIEAIPLFPMRLTPACAPGLHAGPHPLDAPSDLAHHRLLHESDDRNDWPHWASAFDQDELNARAGDAFPNLDMATKAAAMGTGVVMADLVLCRQELDSGTLVAPFPSMVADGAHGDYCLLVEQTNRRADKLQAFIDWACSEADRDRMTLNT